MRLAIITPRYGPEVLGGAETLARNLAEQLAGNHHEVHVWTSCAKDYYRWENIFPAGTSMRNQVTVRRFPITRFDRKRFYALSQTVEQNWGQELTKQQAWLAAGAHSFPLYEALHEEADQYDAILVLPYQATLAQAAAWIAPQRTILIPCLHNEPYAFLELSRLLLAEAFGVLYLTPEEQEFTNNQLKLHPKRADVLGAAVSQISTPPRKPQNPPYLLAMGRLETGKNLALLYDYMKRLAAEGSPVKLLLAGDGSLLPPAQSPFDLRGFVSEDEKQALLAGAVALVQPSLNESFSLVLLESWLANCPVLVHKSCPVTVGHVRRSQGGLAFATYGEFAEAVRLLVDEPEQANQLGENGRSYTLQNYTWAHIIHRLENILNSWLPH